MGCNVACVLLSVLLCCTGLFAAAPNILFYGNSYSISPLGVPTLLQQIALATGREKPNCENASIATYTLRQHLVENTGPITQPEDFVAPEGFQWDFLVVQDHSLRATDIQWKGDAKGYRKDVLDLFELVKQHSPEVTPVVFAAWARSPLNEKDLPGFYPKLTEGKRPPYTKASEQMQRELRKNNLEAAKQLGPKVRLALAGDAFLAAKWDGLYDKDLAHPSVKGQLLASLVVFQAIYGTPATEVDYDAMSKHVPLERYRISRERWRKLTSAAASTITEPPVD